MEEAENNAELPTMTRRGLSADRSGKDGWRRLILPMATEWFCAGLATRGEG